MNRVSAAACVGGVLLVLSALAIGASAQCFSALTGTVCQIAQFRDFGNLPCPPDVVSQSVNGGPAQGIRITTAVPSAQGLSDVILGSNYVCVYRVVPLGPGGACRYDLVGSNRRQEGTETIPVGLPCPDSGVVPDEPGGGGGGDPNDGDENENCPECPQNLG